jgi:CBS domain-containing protein
MGFFVSDIGGERYPYRPDIVQPSEKAGKDKKEKNSSEHRFLREEEEEHRRKFFEASEKLYKKKSVMLASQIMNEKLFLLEEGLTIKKAWELIKDKEIEHFPVVAKSGKLVGLLSEKDILKGIQKEPDKVLKEIISQSTLCADPKTPLQEIMRVFSEQEIDAVPVIDENHRVIGILSRKDLLNTILKVSALRP